MHSISIHAYHPPVNTGEIIRIEASINYSKIYFTEQKPMIVRRVLQWFEEQLEQAGFIRVHRSHLINKNYVKEYISGYEKHIRLTTGDLVPVSRRRHTLTRALLA